MREIINLVEGAAEIRQALDSLRADPAYASIVDRLPLMQGWVPVEKSMAWFSEYHFTGNEAFELPFSPFSYLYSPVVELPISYDTEHRPSAHYKRGVRKFRALISKGEPLPPITIVYDAHWRRWGRQDGNHRFDAAVAEGLPSIPAIFAIPRRLIEAPV